MTKILCASLENFLFPRYNENTAPKRALSSCGKESRDTLKTSTLVKVTAFFTTFTAVACFAVGAVSVTTMNSGRVILGVQAEGTSLAGKTPDNAKRFFDSVAMNRLSRPVARLTYQDKTWTIKPEDIHLTAKTKEAAEAAYAIGRSGTPVENLLEQMRCAIFGRTVELTGAYDSALLDEKLQNIKESIDRDPVNASITLTKKGTLQKQKEVQGLALDTEPIKTALDGKLRSLKLTARVSLAPSVTEPFVRDADIAAIDSVLGTYTTSFSPGARGDNIILAASKLQGALIRSQATLSFNDTVGRRTRDAGYQNAGVIIDGEPAIDVGGGVCQVSTTLYNAVLLAGLTPTVRSNHSLPSSYVPAGRDATVADGLLDFVFQNPLPHPVYLVATETGSRLTISVLGTRADLAGKTVALVTEGSRKKPTLYRIWSQNGEVIDREYMHTDSYS